MLEREEYQKTDSLNNDIVELVKNNFISYEEPRLSDTLYSPDQRVIENFYTDYQSPAPSKLSKLKAWRNNLGKKTGICITKTIQVVSNVNYASLWKDIQSFSIFQTSKIVIKTYKKTLAFIASMVGLGYFTAHFDILSLLQAITAEPMEPTLRGMFFFIIMACIVVALKLKAHLCDSKDMTVSVPVGEIIILLIPMLVMAFILYKVS